MRDILFVVAAAISAALSAGDKDHAKTVARSLVRGVAIYLAGGVVSIEEGAARILGDGVVYTTTAYTCTCYWHRSMVQGLKAGGQTWYHVPVCKHMVAYALAAKVLTVLEVIKACSAWPTKLQWDLMVNTFLPEGKAVQARVLAFNAAPAPPPRELVWVLKVIGKRNIVLVADEHSGIARNSVLLTYEPGTTLAQLWDQACARFGRDNLQGVKPKRVYKETAELLSPLVP